LWDALARPVSRRRAGGADDVRRTLWALRDVSLEVEVGEAVGIIGRNGAGKTTLLKILSRITEPTKGRATLAGRVGSLLEVGTGFHPELTGRENVLLNGAILGMRRREINRKFDDIVGFAEVERFIDTPVKRYSSGMLVRLAFAVAAHLEPDILIVDEVLAVGDASFQKRSMGKMGEVATEGRTVLFVSHNMAAVQALCKRAFLLDSGRLTAEGPVHHVLQEYARQAASLDTTLESNNNRQGDGRLRVERFQTRSGAGGQMLACGAPAEFLLIYSSSAELRNVHFSMALHSLIGEPVMYLSNELSGDWFDELPASGVISCSFDRLPLLPGTYRVTLFSSVGGVTADWVVDAAMIEVGSGDFFGSGKLPDKEYGSIAVPHRWSARSE
jgi:lipopolysaccharide transport system ATP-binding protein